MPTTLTLQPTGQVLTVPTKWADVTLAQFVDLEAREPDDERRPAEILLGLEATGLDQLAADDVRYIANLIEFALEPQDVYALHPTPGLPEVGSLPYGTLIMAQQRFSEDPEQPWLRSAAYLLALYRVQMTYGKYDSAKVAACEAALLVSPCTEVYPDAAFFLNSYKRYSSGTGPTLTTTSAPTTTKSKRGMSKFLSGLGLYSGWMPPPRGTY
jgi:hypothetical protein